VRRCGTALLSGTALLCLLVGSACGPGRIVRHGQVNEDALAVVRRTLPAIRGLKFEAPVPAAVLSREEIVATVAGEIDRSYAPGDIERLEAVYARLGLLPPGTRLRPVLQRLYEQEGAGFYDPRTKRLVLARTALGAGGLRVELVGRLTGRDLVGEFLVAHELTHALQDQHYGMRTTPEPLIDGHGDAELARHALLEGDATLAGFAYLAGRPLDRATISTVERQLRGVPDELAAKYPDVPEVVRASLAFQYDDGTAFAGWALADGGWPAVDRVHADPPDSTEQVLHPARYFATRDRPVTIALGGTEALERAGWTRILEDTLGELQIRVLAARSLPPERAAGVADGWGGDRLRALARGAELALVWMTAWDSPSEAAEFAQAMPEVVRGARIEQRDDRVVVLLDAPLDTARVWSRTRFDGRSVRPPA
jgi:hypothetical protein